MDFLRSLKLLARHNSYFLIPYFLLFLVGFILSLSTNKGEAVIWLNAKHEATLDQIMVFLSFVGEGSIFGVLLLLIGFFKFKYLFKGLVCYLVSVGVTAILKMIFDHLRPIKYFTEIDGFNFVEGVRLHGYLSFPSGHTTSGFSMMMFLCLITPNKYLKALFVFFASLIGISRVYLFQHFLQDIVLGSFIGVTCTLLLFHYFDTHHKIPHSKWYNYSLYERFFHK